MPFPQKTPRNFGKLRIDFLGGYGMMKVLIIFDSVLPESLFEQCRIHPKGHLVI